MAMESGRPLTSLAAEYHHTATCSEAESRGDEYVPHLFDLIHPMVYGIGQNSARDSVPKIYLSSEAVDSSHIIGQGASFIASRQFVIENEPANGADGLLETGVGSDWTVMIEEPKLPKNKYVVYKAANVKFQENGRPIPEHQRAFESVLTELHALLQPRLVSHPNIIDLLDLSWGSNPYNIKHKLPVLVVEYAEYGTLANLQKSNPNLSADEKRLLCLDVGLGLEVLHESEIVHGDIKPENILVFAHKSRRFIAKLADFGFSVLRPHQNLDISIGGTRTWRAPETDKPIPAQLLPLTDIFSFGLLVWSVSVNGMDPFDIILQPLSQDQKYNEIDRLKKEDKLLSASKFTTWASKWLAIDETERDSLRNKCIASDNEKKVEKTTSQEVYLENIDQALVLSLEESSLYYGLDSIFQKSLSSDPMTRDLDSIIAILRKEDVDIQMTTTLQRQHLHENPLVDPAPALETHIVTVTITLPPIEKDTASDDSTAEPSKDTTVASPRKMQFQIDRMSNTSEAGVLPLLIEDSESGKSMVLRIPTIPQPSRNIPMSDPMIRFKHSLLSWQIVKSLEPSVQRLVLDSIPGNDGPQIFCLAALVMNGYGTEPDAQVALKHVAHSAYHEEPNAQAYLYRLSVACDVPIPPFFPLVKFLKYHAQLGSRMALQDLNDVDPVIAAEVHHRSRSGYGGVGADWYFPENMFHDYTQPKLAKFNFLLAQASTAEDMYQLKINRRGDSLLHFAASSGFRESVVALIEDLGVDINFVNECGETALLCACRAAHYGIIDFLLNNDANPSIQAKNGESALHWLISLDDTRGIAVGQRLLDAGADVDSMLLQRVTHSTFKAALDIDILRDGTPLTWAVQCDRPDMVKLLLSNGASPLKQSQLWKGGKQYPLGLAAYFHRAECLKIMLTAFEERELSGGSSRGYLVSPLLELAVGSADKFSMILRNSTKYKEQLHMTLALLIEQHSRYISPSNSTSWGAGHCYDAVTAGHWDVVEFFLSNRWQADQINQPYGKPQRTCLLESVRFNRRSIFMSLVEHGADPLAKASNPFNTELLNWTALHIFAEAAHDTDLTLVTTLIELGVPVDGRVTDDSNTDTPFCISVCNDSFNLANKLLSLGANPNAIQTQSSIVRPLYPMTPLGRIIITNARFSSNRLNYLLFQCGSVEPAFIVEPKRQLSALHRVSMAYRDVLTISGTPIKPENFDMETNREIAREILKKFSGKEHLNLKCDIEGKTALHLAVQARNIGVVRELLDAGADRSIKDDAGITPTQLALELAVKQLDMRDIVRLLTRVDV